MRVLGICGAVGLSASFAPCCSSPIAFLHLARHRSTASSRWLKGPVHHPLCAYLSIYRQLCVTTKMSFSDRHPCQAAGCHTQCVIYYGLPSTCSVACVEQLQACTQLVGTFCPTQPSGPFSSGLPCTLECVTTKTRQFHQHGW